MLNDAHLHPTVLSALFSCLTLFFKN